jgi:Flp pilus assembly protein TadG
MDHCVSQQKTGLPRQNQRNAPRSFGGFGRDHSGTSAVEFALVAAPLIFLLLGILQVGVVFFSNFALEDAVERGARLVRTGQAQGNGFDAAKFKSEVCKFLIAPISCAGLKLDIRSYSNFGSAAAGLTEPLDSSGNMKTNFSYDPGVGGDVVIVRAFYELGLAAQIPALISLGNMGSGRRLLMATAAFRNEPFN